MEEDDDIIDEKVVKTYYVVEKYDEDEEIWLRTQAISHDSRSMKARVYIKEIIKKMRANKPDRKYRIVCVEQVRFTAIVAEKEVG